MLLVTVPSAIVCHLSCLAMVTVGRGGKRVVTAQAVTCHSSCSLTLPLTGNAIFKRPQTGARQRPRKVWDMTYIVHLIYSTQ